MRSRVDLREGGMALMAVLVALTVLLLLAIPFAVSMTVGADAASQTVLVRRAEQASASARDLLLADAALGHPTYDTSSPTYDDRSEFPDGVRVPPAFTALGRDGRVLLGGEVVDLQRKIALDAATPLLLANLLGTTARLTHVLAPDSVTVQVDGGDRLPDQGFVWVDFELIRYGSRQGGTLAELSRGLFPELGFAKPSDHSVAEGALALDWRCVLAATWAFDGRTGGTRRERHPLQGVGELAEIGSAGYGAFTAAELDLLDTVLTADTHAVTAPTFGRPERVFNDLQPPARTLRVKSAVHLGAGSVVRIRDLRRGAVEWGVVMAASTPQGVRDLLLPSQFDLHLLHPVTQEFHGVDTVVEPLVPAPVNVNTAAPAVLTALVEQVRHAADVHVHEATGNQRPHMTRWITASEARAFAEQVDALRQGGSDEPGHGPFTGWQDLAERLFRPRFEEAGTDEDKSRWLDLYRDLLSGRDSALEMGTVPICFDSGPWVAYRAAASVSRSAVAPGVAARHERTGTALAIPGWPLEQDWSTQEVLEEAFRLDQRAQFFVTTPVNTGAVAPNNPGNDPVSRYFPHVVAMAFPQAGLGQPRFPTRDKADSGIQLGTVVAPPGGWAGEIRGHESFSTEIDPRGHDVGRDGAYKIPNTGPRDTQPAPKPPQDHSLRFPFSSRDGAGGSGRWAVSFWAEPDGLRQGTYVDYATEDRNRNRISLRVQDQDLLLEVLDEAGLDPDPGASPAGLQRTASEWRVPVADIALPARTPVHLSMSAFAGRSSSLSLAVDGVTRGRASYRTWLTSAIKVWDPSLGGNGQAGSRNDWEVELPVESTKGFPPVGIVRIGTELFEYSSLTAGSFRCRFKDSLGGRGRRQIGREFRPDIPVDQNGKPTVDISTLQNQGVNLDVYPDHPVGSQVELYGYSALLSVDTPLHVGAGTLTAGIGAFAVARGFTNNARPIAITIPRGPSIPIGRGIDTTWSGDLELSDPQPSAAPSYVYPPTDASAPIQEAFPRSGGYALLVQRTITFSYDQVNVVSTPVTVGGVEVIRYGSRDGNKLKSVTRAASLPGNDAGINRGWYTGQARQFVCDWADGINVPRTQPPLSFDGVPQLILWVVPISLPVTGTNYLADPQKSGLVEWLQLYDKSREADTEWVRYDTILDNNVLRASRQAWGSVYFALTEQSAVDSVSVGRLGNSTGPILTANGIWGSVAMTPSDAIGYVPKLESDWPQIHAARGALAFRGDPFTNTSSHPQASADALPCHRVMLFWGNYGAHTGRPGRNDRLALVPGSGATGTQRPAVEWHTVNWSVRRYGTDQPLRNNEVRELMGTEPFQLVAFKERAAVQLLGPPPDLRDVDVRRIDRMVKFPSGELPMAFCESLHVGSAVGGGERVGGIVDEVDVTEHQVPDLIVDEAFTAGDRQFKVHPHFFSSPAGPRYNGGDLSAALPPGGGLLLCDGEILAYQSRGDGTVTLAENGRGLLHTDARGHDRGAIVHFLTHRPAAILTGAVTPRSDRLPVQGLGAMPARGGTALLGSELLHWTWTRVSGDQVAFEMPRHHLPEDAEDPAKTRGLLRGRFGTMPGSASVGSPVILWPCRFWDRRVERSDDPELANFQCSHFEAPVFFEQFTWEQETTDPAVDVECLCRVDGSVPWTADPEQPGGLLRLVQGKGDGQGQGGHEHVLGRQGRLFEARFQVVYRPGCFDYATMGLHAWKTTPKIKNVRLEFEGEGTIVAERTSTR